MLRSCFHELFTRDRCCGPGKGVAGGDPTCWYDPYFHVFQNACCGIDRQAAFYRSLARVLRTWFSGPERTQWNMLGFRSLHRDGPRIIEAFQEFTTHLIQSNRSATIQLPVTVSMVLRALDPNGSPALRRLAYSSFLATESTLLACLEGDWPVFALLDLLDGQFVEPLAVGAGVQPSCAEVCASNIVETALVDCAVACAAAAVALPLVHSLRGRPEDRANVTAFRDAFLGEAELAVRGLGLRGLKVLGARGFWATLHRLQSESYLRAACPGAGVLVRTDSEPANDICLPDQPETSRFTEMVLRGGRWRDCDILYPLAAISGILNTSNSLAVDVGSNVGACSMYLLAMGLRIEALDPDPHNVELLRGAGWKEEEAGRLRVHEAVASNVEREACELDDECAALSLTRGPRAVRLDRLLAHEPGPMLIKIDVEGAELDVLQGAKGLMRGGKVHAVNLELHTELLDKQDVDPWEVLSLLLRYGLLPVIMPMYTHEHTYAWPIQTRAQFITARATLEAQEGPNLQVTAQLNN